MYIILFSLSHFYFSFFFSVGVIDYFAEFGNYGDLRSQTKVGNISNYWEIGLNIQFPLIFAEQNSAIAGLQEHEGFKSMRASRA